MTKPKTTKTSIFPIRNREDAQRAQEIMERLVSSKDPAEQEVFQIFHALMRDWSAQQPKMEKPPAHEIIRAVLELRDISQRDFAKMLETSETSVSAILNGTRPLTQKTARKVTQALGLSEGTLSVPKSRRNRSKAA